MVAITNDVACKCKKDENWEAGQVASIWFDNKDLEICAMKCELCGAEFISFVNWSAEGNMEDITDMGCADFDRDWETKY